MPRHPVNLPRDKYEALYAPWELVQEQSDESLNQAQIKDCNGTLVTYIALNSLGAKRWLAMIELVNSFHAGVANA